jgi:nucleoside phosphorylase
MCRTFFHRAYYMVRSREPANTRKRLIERNRQDRWQPNDAGSIDWVVLTAIPEEFEAVIDQLDGPVTFGFPVPAKVGNVARSRVLCVLSGKGSDATATVLTAVISDTKVNKALLIGIAGGFPEQKMTRGDVIVAKTILAYDFGKLVGGKYIRRPEKDWQCDSGLVSYAMLAAHKPWFDRIKIRRPDGRPANASTVRDGFVASGDKVVDDDEHPFFREATKNMEEIHAVEMESVGAGAAVQFRQTMGVLRFLMIKGISDEPHAGVATGSDPGTGQRAQWKRYAASAAAALAHGLIEEMALDETSRSPAPESMDRPKRTRGKDDALEIAGLYRRFQTDWRPGLSAWREGAISVADAVDWLLRSLIPAFEQRPSLMKALEARAWDKRLPPHLPKEEEAAIRQLRNLGLVRHDGPWLLTPTRSAVVEPTPAGRLLIALHEGAGPGEREQIAAGVASELSEIALDAKAIDLLEAVDRGSKVSTIDAGAVRRLRDLHLIAHEDEFLPPAERLRVTGLGRYVLRSGKS